MPTSADSLGMEKAVIRGMTMWSNGRAAACALGSTRCLIGPHCMITIVRFDLLRQHLNSGTSAPPWVRRNPLG